MAVGFVVGGVAWVLLSLVWDLVRQSLPIDDDDLFDDDELADRIDELADAYNHAVAERAWWQDRAQALDAQVVVLRQKLDQAERLLSVVDPEATP